MFNDEHADISAELLLGFLTVIGLATDFWARDGLQIYREYGLDDKMMPLVSKVFRAAIAGAKAADADSAHLSLEKDVEYAPESNAEKARKKAREKAAQEAATKAEELAKLARAAEAKASKAKQSDPFVFASVIFPCGL